MSQSKFTKNLRERISKFANIVIFFLTSTNNKIEVQRHPYISHLGKRCLILSELLNVLNLPLSIIFEIFKLRNSLVLIYISSSLLIKDNFGKFFIHKQISFAIQFELFESKAADFVTENQDKLDFMLNNNRSSPLNRLKIDIFIQLALGRHELIPDLFGEFLTKLNNASCEELQSIGNTVANYLHERGYFEIAEQIEIKIKRLLDEKTKRKPGLRNECTYLTAIGHISLLGYLIMGRMTGLIPRVDISIVHDPKRVVSPGLANLIIDKSKNIDVRFVAPSQNNFMESNLELFPDLHGYVIARNHYEDIFESYKTQFSTPFLGFADLSDEIVDTAESILMEHGFSTDSKYVGIHVRENQNPSRANRNSRFDSIVQALQYVENLGFITVRLGNPDKGDSRNQSRNLKGVDFTQKKMSNFERDCLQLYIWSKSEFFIGNLSGGTLPPSLFGIPTIHFDVFPLKHIIPPSKTDLVLPKRLFNLVDGKILPIEDVFSREFNFLQIENIIRLQGFGFGLKTTSSNEIIDAVNKLILRNSAIENSERRVDNSLDSRTSVRAAQLLARMPFAY